jgi:hypothetical protein
MEQFAIVYFLAGNIENIQTLRKLYDPHWTIIPPHITIISPFDLHNKLASILPAPHDINAAHFDPHVTLGVLQTDDKQHTEDLYHKARIDAEKMNLDICDIVNEITLIQGDGLTPARILHKFSLS